MTTTIVVRLYDESVSWFLFHVLFFSTYSFYLCADYLKRSLITVWSWRHVDRPSYNYIFILYEYIFLYITIVVTIMCSRFREKRERQKERCQLMFDNQYQLFRAVLTFCIKCAVTCKYLLFLLYDKSRISSHQPKRQRNKMYLMFEFEIANVIYNNNLRYRRRWCQADAAKMA